MNVAQRSYVLTDKTEEQVMTSLKMIPALFLVVMFMSRTTPAQENQTVFTFDHEKTGQPPAGWKIEATHPGENLALWQVTADKTAPTGKNILSLTDVQGNYGSTFNLCWNDKISFLNGQIDVKIRANTGNEDQGGGVIWRARDKDNYYIARMNPLEDNFRLYFVKNGKRKMLASSKISLPAGEWHALKITQKGSILTGSIDGNLLLETEDNTFPEAGGIGLWTKADAATSFDELKVMADDESEENGDDVHEKKTR
jgi:hypothetical protein